MVIAPFSNLQSSVVMILGLKPWAFFGIFFIVMVGIFIIYTRLWDGYKQGQNRKKMKGKILGVFVTADRKSYETPCGVDMHEVYPTKDKKVKAIGTITGSSIGKGQHRIPQYYIRPEFCFLVFWPKGAKLAQQVEIMETFYRENFSLPALCYEDMSSDERVKITALMNQMSADQNVADAQLTEVQGREAAFTKALARLNSLKYLNYFLIAIGAIGIFTLFYAFQTFGIASVIRKFMGIP
jgi:hypothetical protein